MTMQKDYLGFLLSQTTHIEQQAYQVRYADIQYPRLVPVDTSATEWARSITHFSMDQVGQAEIFAGRATDIPLADITTAKHEVPVEMAAIGYDYTIDELGTAMMVPNMQLGASKAMAARRAAEEFIDNIVLNGNADYGWDGLLDNSNVPKADVETGAGGGTDWRGKTPDEILADVNDALEGIWTGSRTIEMADTLALPSTAIKEIATRRLEGTATSLRMFLNENNLYTAMTGQSLTIVLLRGLENAASTNRGRLIAYKRDPGVLKLHLPMPHRFLPAQQWLLRYVVPGIFRLGGLEIRRPMAIRYMDGITT